MKIFFVLLSLTLSANAIAETKADNVQTCKAVAIKAVQFLNKERGGRLSINTTKATPDDLLFSVQDLSANRFIRYEGYFVTSTAHTLNLAVKDNIDEIAFTYIVKTTQPSDGDCLITGIDLVNAPIGWLAKPVK